MAAHYKPQSVRHHDVSYDKIDTAAANNSSQSTDSNNKNQQNSPPAVEETTLNQTHDSVLGHTNDSNVVKRSPRYVF